MLEIASALGYVQRGGPVVFETLETTELEGYSRRRIEYDGDGGARKFRSRAVGTPI